MKDSLVFDTTDANTILDSDSVGAYIRSADGTQITHTTAGSKEALDVNIAASDITIDVDLDHTTDSVALGDGTSLFTSTSENSDIALDVHISNTSIAVTATDLDIRDLTHVSDSIKIGDGTDFLAVNADGSINVVSTADPALAATAIATAANPLSVALTAEDVVASPLANRKYLFIYNNGNRQVYVGQSGVSAATGFPLSPGSTMELRAGAAVDIEWVGPNTSQEIRTLELS